MGAWINTANIRFLPVSSSGSTHGVACVLAVAGLLLGACANTTYSESYLENISKPESESAYQPSPLANHGKNSRTIHNNLSTYGVIDYFDKEEIVTLNAGFNGITERYIESVSIKRLAFDALEGLSSIDPSLDINFTGPSIKNTKRVILKMTPFDHSAFEGGRSQPIDTFKLPETTNSREWAKLVSSVVNTAKDHSQVLGMTGREKVLEALFDGMLVGLDIFSRYAGAIEADHNRARREGFGGIGIHFKAEETLLGIGKKGFPITSVKSGTPAHIAGLVEGDRIISISGHNVSGFKTRKLAALLRGPVGSGILIGILRENSGLAPITFQIVRAHIIPETVVATVKNNLLNIRINSFNRLTATAVSKAIINIDKKIDSGQVRGIIMDLRDNPGGLLMQSVNVADLFLSKGDIVATNGRHRDSDHSYYAGGMDVARALPMAVLIDGDSASAAEVLAGALQDQGRAVIVGSNSYGKGSVQTVLSLPNSGEITLTWSRLITPSGYAIHKLGIMPNICANFGSAIPTGAQLNKSEATLAMWREMGVDFGKKRAFIRRTCPGVIEPGNEQIAHNLAQKIVNNSDLYTRAIAMSKPVSTARMER